jgi:hypothetical protein
MRSPFVRLSVVTAFIMFVLARTGSAQVCVTIDPANDMLRPQDRTAALILLKNQFQLAGQQVVDHGCAGTYSVSHVILGSTITVTMSGPNGYREGKAMNVDDLPPLYNQMVRSMLNGEPVGSFGVIDRTNVTAAQNVPQRRIQSDSFWYARLGYAGVFGQQAEGAPSMGFGYRAEFDSFGVDFSFLNYATHSPASYYVDSASANVGSWLKLEGLYFANPLSNRTPYYGAGLSWGSSEVASGDGRDFRGSGMQGEVTAGYEIGRAASVRFFMQADAVLPFYNATSTTYTYSRLPNGTYNYYTPPTVSVDRRYTPSLVFSIGVGWQKGRR